MTRPHKPANPLGIHGALLPGSWSGCDGWPALTVAAELGYDVVEIPLWDVATFDAKDIARGLRELDLASVCSMVLDDDTDIASDDPAVVARGRELLLRAVDHCAAVGATALGGVIYGSMGAHSEPPSEAGWANCAATLAVVAEHAAPGGVTLALEVANRYESRVLNTAAQALELIELSGAPNVGVELDSYHMHIEETDLCAPVEACADRLAYVQVGESHRGWLGTGMIDFDAFLRAVLRAGYTGPITFEAFSRSQLPPATAGRLSLWRDHWTGGAELVARHAREFLAARLSAAELVLGRAS